MGIYDEEVKRVMAEGYPFKGAYIAGGAITSIFTNSKINDVDFYFKSYDDFVEGVFQAYEEGFWCVASSKRSVTFSDNGRIYQLMHFDFFPQAADIFKAFDFTVCMGAIDLDTRELVLHDEFLKHNSQRFLRFNHGTKFPLASATRVLKYQARGYTLGKGDMLKIVLACRGVKIDNWEDLKDQIGGAYGDKVELAGEGQEFTLENAINSLTVDADGADTWIRHNLKNNEPGGAESLLAKLAALKGETFVPPVLDECDWPVRMAA